MPLIVVERHAHGPRVWVTGRRSHHGAWGALLAMLGGWLMWDDRRDWPWLPSRR